MLFKNYIKNNLDIISFNIILFLVFLICPIFFNYLAPLIVTFMDTMDTAVSFVHI